MIDLTKEEQAFFVGYEYWDETRGMQPIAGGDWYWADEVNEVVTALQKRIVELEKAIRDSCKRIVSTNEMPEWDDVYQILIPVLHQSEGGVEVSDET